MSVGGIEETVTVSGAVPVVDVQQVQRIEVLSKEVQEAIPTGRSAWSYALLIPGVKVHKADVGGSAGAQQSEMMGRGLDAAHNSIEIDGMIVSPIFQDGRYQAYLNPLLAAETSYTTTGNTAETQQGGLRMNMIPEEGGNNYSGKFFAGQTPGYFQSDNHNPRLADLGISEVPKIDLIYDYNAAVGGPFARDKLWFFASARRNVVNAQVTNSIYRDGSPGIDDNSITNGNLRLTWQVSDRHKFSAMFDKVRKRRFHQHGFGTDIETASASWTSPHYDTGTAKWTSTLSTRSLVEIGFSLNYGDWDPGYQEGIFQPRPADDALATCFSTPCFPPVGSPEHLAQLAGGDPWYNVVHRNDDWLDFRYGAKNYIENNYTRRWAYMGAFSYVTGSHNFKFGANITNGNSRYAYGSNGDLDQRYASSPNPLGRSLGFMDGNCDHYAAAVNRAAGLPCGTIGTPDAVGVYNHPTFSKSKLDYNGGIYAQDSWTIDRLTINYGLRMDFASVSVPSTPKPLGRFVNVFAYPAAENLPRFGPDWAPRLSVAYDLFGDARTALKFGWNKYVSDVGVYLPERYSVATRATDVRDWFDCHLIAAGTACSGLNPYGGNGDDIAQNWEIGPGQEIFGFRSPNTPDLDNFAREYNHIWTAGLQQELVQGLSIGLEFRRRAFHNTWSADNLEYNLSDFGALPDGSPDPAMAGTGRYFDLVRPYPYVGSVTVFNIDPAVRLQTDNVDRTRGPGYSNVYHGFELSIQGRMPGGGSLFGGWTVEDTGRTTIYNYDRSTGGTRYGGEVNDCADVLARGRQPQRAAILRRRHLPASVPARVQAVGNGALLAAGPRRHAVRGLVPGLSGRRRRLGRPPGRSLRPPHRRRRPARHLLGDLLRTARPVRRPVHARRPTGAGGGLDDQHQHVGLLDPHDPAQQREVHPLLDAARRQHPEGVQHRDVALRRAARALQRAQLRCRDLADRFAQRERQHRGRLPGPFAVGTREQAARREGHPPGGHRALLDPESEQGLLQRFLGPGGGRTVFRPPVAVNPRRWVTLGFGCVFRRCSVCSP